MDHTAHATPAIRLSDLLGALSYALDLTEGQPEGHCVRCCWIGLRVGQEIGLSEGELRDLYYTILLKDLGCSSNAARICRLYLADDRSFKRDYKTVSDGLPQVLRFVLTHTGMKSNLSERFRAIINIMQNGGEIARELIETRCQRGADIARQMRFSEHVAAGIQSLDEHWDGGGQPGGRVGADVPLYARIALLTQVVDVFHRSTGREAACQEIVRRSGRWFDPDIVAAFTRVAAAHDFWSTLESPGIDQVIFALEPAQQMTMVDEDYLDDISAAFAQVVDSKSPWTQGHSSRVAFFTDLIAGQLDFEPGRRRRLVRGALLHDIGKLGVSNQILDKPGRPDEDEWIELRRHSELGEAILGRIAGFEAMAHLAGSHHERLDGKGYPRGLLADEIGLETRIITTADIFDALTAERPYRAAMPTEKALAIMRADVGTALDASCFAALEGSLAKLDAEAAVKLAAQGPAAATLKAA